MFFSLKMWNSHGQYWPEDQSWLNASPFGQYSPLGSVQASLLSQTHPPVSTQRVSPVPESRSTSPASFRSKGSVSVGSDDGVSNHLAVNSVNTNRRKQWSKEQVLALLDLYEKRRNDFRDPKKRNEDVWEAIGKELEELGFPDKRNAGDCESKFKNLKRSYITKVDHNNTSGNERKTCAYFDEMSNLFKKDARIQPVTLCSSRVGTKIVSKSDKDVTCSESENEDIPRKRKRKPQAKHDLLSLFKEFIQTREKTEIERMQELRGYGYHQRENTGSRLFTELKPCWTGLISGWVTI